jgi:hypothetical protein
MKPVFVDCAARNRPRAAWGITRLAALATAILAAGAISRVAYAQGGAPAPSAQGATLPPAAQDSRSPPAATEGRAQAPVGHRQPRPQDLPADVLRDENGAARSPVDRELDHRIQICRDC